MNKNLLKDKRGKILSVSGGVITSQLVRKKRYFMKFIGLIIAVIGAIEYFDFFSIGLGEILSLALMIVGVIVIIWGFLGPKGHYDTHTGRFIEYVK